MKLKKVGEIEEITTNSFGGKNRNGIRKKIRNGIRNGIGNINGRKYNVSNLLEMGSNWVRKLERYMFIKVSFPN